MEEKLKELKELLESNIRGIEVELQGDFMLNGEVKIKDTVHDKEFLMEVKG